MKTWIKRTLIGLSAGFGSVLRIIADGWDEDAAISELSELFLSGFGEL